MQTWYVSFPCVSLQLGTDPIADDEMRPLVGSRKRKGDVVSCLPKYFEML